MKNGRLIDSFGSSHDQDPVWETFHENSKTSRFELPPSDHDVSAHMAVLAESLEYHGYPLVKLPHARAPLTIPLGDAILRRTTARRITRAAVSPSALSTLLGCAYGVSHDERSLGYSRAFRTVPSAGALYPLELYLFVAPGADLDAGLYHYNPIKESLRFLRSGDLSDVVADTVVQPEIAGQASLIIFITAFFSRSTFKYGERGYRFALLEAGHVAQNINLAAVGLGLGSVNLGGFYDRRVDELLDLDGLTHSTIYLVAIGQDSDKGTEAASV
jgi:SagB-type dehydrogenase family enzyme